MVPIGTTEKYYEKHNIIHNPEFLTARNAIQDFANNERNIVGGDMDLCVDFVHMFEKYLRDCILRSGLPDLFLEALSSRASRRKDEKIAARSILDQSLFFFHVSASMFLPP